MASRSHIKGTLNNSEHKKPMDPEFLARMAHLRRQTDGTSSTNSTPRASMVLLGSSASITSTDFSDSFSITSLPPVVEFPPTPVFTDQIPPGMRQLELLSFTQTPRALAPDILYPLQRSQPVVATRSVDTTHDEASDWTPRQQLTNLPAFTRSVPHYVPPRQTTTTTTSLSDTRSLDTTHENASSSITSLGSNLTPRRQQPTKPPSSTRSVPHYSPPKQTPNTTLSDTRPLDTSHEEAGSSTASPRSNLTSRRQPIKPPASTRHVPHPRQTRTRTTPLSDITQQPTQQPSGSASSTPRTTNPLTSPPPQPSNHSPPPIIPLEVQTHPPPPPDKAGLKAWWEQFAFTNSFKTDSFRGPHGALDATDHPVFGKPLMESLRYASVQISTAKSNAELYVWGYVPVVIAKCGLYLKENATEVPGVFNISGSIRRMRELQAAFESPPCYGKSIDWKKELSYTTHDIASIFQRFLAQMPEPVIPHEMYHSFRDAFAKEPFIQEQAITTCKSLIRGIPRANQCLLLYVLDLFSNFARKSDKNLMTAPLLAAIFCRSIISHPQHETLPHEHALSQRVLKFMIDQQDWFMNVISYGRYQPIYRQVFNSIPYGTCLPN